MKKSSYNQQFSGKIWLLQRNRLISRIFNAAYQQNQSIKTPSAASETVSSPPCTGYIQSQNPLKPNKQGRRYKMSPITHRGYQQHSSIVTETILKANSEGV